MITLKTIRNAQGVKKIEELGDIVLIELNDLSDAKFLISAIGMDGTYKIDDIQVTVQISERRKKRGTA
jgi:hypothetical protein